MRLPKTVLWTVPALAVAAALAYVLTDPGPPAPELSTTPIARGEIAATVSATGTVSPLIEVLVGSQVSGTIASLSVDFNSAVRAGEVIAQIDPALFQARVAEAEANLLRARAERDKAQVALAEARRNVERLRDLKARRLVSESELDTASFALQAAEAQLRIADAQAQQNAAALNYARLNLDYTTIHAPIDGVVISRDVDVGQTVAASLQAPTLFTIARDLRRMQIETDVDEAYIGQVAEGQPVSFTVFAYPERRFTGRVAQVRLQPKVEAGVVKYNCVIHVDNDDLALKPGMTATVAIEVARRTDVLKVPNAALRFVPTLPADELKALQRGIKPGQSVLWTPTNGTLQPLRVQIGIVGETETEVSGDSLAEGLEVAVPLTRDRSANGRARGFRLF